MKIIGLSLSLVFYVSVSFAQDSANAFFPYPKADRIIEHHEASSALQLKDSSLFISFFFNGFQNFMNDSSNPLSYRIKEDFFFKVDKDGLIIEIEDCRTKTNNNTSYLQKEDLIEMLKFRFTAAQIDGKNMNCKIPLRFDVEVNKTPYVLKFRKNKIKVLESPTTKAFYAEYIREGHPHYDSLKNWICKQESKEGKYTLTLIDLKFAVKEMQQVEFNPFKEEKRSLLQQAFIKIIE